MSRSTQAGFSKEEAIVSIRTALALLGIGGALCAFADGAPYPGTPTPGARAHPVASATAAMPGDPEHDRLVDAFLAALPPSESEPEPVTPDEKGTERLAALAARYPAKSAAIEAILVERARCSHAASQKGTAKVMRDTAESLDSETLRALIAFYTGPDYAKLDTLKEGTPEFDAFAAKHGLMKLYDAMKAQFATMFEAVFASEFACDEARDAALADIGVSE